MFYLDVILFFFIVVRLHMLVFGQEYPIPSPVVSTECIELGLCDAVDNYPTLIAQKLSQDLKDKNVILTNDSEWEETRKNKETEENISEDADLSPRFGDYYDYKAIYSSEEEDKNNNICESVITYHYPKVAENINNTWKFIINDHNQPIQRFRTERCKSSIAKRSEIMTFLSYYEAVCYQRWTLKEMYYIDENGSYRTDYFKVPTCCSLKLYRTYK